MAKFCGLVFSLRLRVSAAKSGGDGGIEKGARRCSDALSVVWVGLFALRELLLLCGVALRSPLLDLLDGHGPFDVVGDEVDEALAV